MALGHLSRVFSFSLIAVLAMTSQAEAQTLGDVLTRVTTSINSFPSVLAGITYLLGIFFAAWGIFKFKDHVDNPSGQIPLSAGVKRFLAGGMLLVAPYMSDVLYTTLAGAGGAGLQTTSYHAAPGGTGMDQMIYSLITNIAAPAEMLLIVFTYLSAIILLITGITRLIKTAQDGPRGPAGLGTVMTFVACGALFAFGDMMGTFSSSLFGDAQVSTYATIDPGVISDPGDSARISAVIESLMIFIGIVGYIAFIRGWFVLKAFADGHNNASVAQALTFLFGGALAINLGELVNILQATVGITGGITFG